MVSDPRVVANELLEQADTAGYDVSAVALQRLLYLAHGLLLCRRGEPLVDGHFEAWETGPVHPVVQQAFPVLGPIQIRARRVNALTGVRSALPELTDPVIRGHLERVASSYNPANLNTLNAVMMADGGPWQMIREKGERSIALGFRIPNELIRERFRFQKVSADQRGLRELPSRDRPPA